MLKFNGKFTIMNSKTGQHRTFMIKTQPADAGFAPNKRVIYLFTGNENDDDSHYTGFGFVEDNGIKVWSKKRGTVKEPSFFDRCATMVWSLATLGDESPYLALGVTVELSKRCRVCNRTLTNPASLESGIGPECERRLGKPARTSWLTTEEQL